MITYLECLPLDCGDVNHLEDGFRRVLLLNYLALLGRLLGQGHRRFLFKTLLSLVVPGVVEEPVNLELVGALDDEREVLRVVRHLARVDEVEEAADDPGYEGVGRERGKVGKG